MFVKGEGVTRNGVQKETSKKEKPKDVFALIRAGRVKKYHPWITKIMEEFLAGNIAKHANFGASAYDLSLLASGSIEAVIYATMTTIDIAGAIGMVREAGGEVYSAKGIPVEISYEPQPIIAVASSALFEKMKPLLHLNLT